MNDVYKASAAMYDAQIPDPDWVRLASEDCGTSQPQVAVEASELRNLKHHCSEQAATLLGLTDRVIRLENRSGVYDAATIARILDRLAKLEKFPVYRRYLPLGEKPPCAECKPRPLGQIMVTGEGNCFYCGRSVCQPPAKEG